MHILCDRAELHVDRRKQPERNDELCWLAILRVREAVEITSP